MTAVKKTWTVKEIQTWISERFTSANLSTPLLDAQLLLLHAIPAFKNRIDLYIHSEKILKSSELEILRGLIKRRLLHEPVAYITQQKFWYNLDLYVTPDVLIPRPETETLLDFVLDAAALLPKPKVIFDLCTGSGCLAIALGKIFPEAKIFAFDVSTQALDVAKQNMKRNQVANVEFIELNLSEDSAYDHVQSHFPKADVIVSNPPYISLEDWKHLGQEVKDYEPKHALTCESDGLLIGQKIFENIMRCSLLNEKGIFGMELDHGQPQKLIGYGAQSKIFVSTLPKMKYPTHEWFVLKDLEQKERFLIKIGA